MQIIDCVQGEPEWLAIRTGMITSSMFKEIITSKGAPTSKTRSDKYIDELAGEFVSQEKSDDFKSYHMQRGTDLEPESKRFYEFLTGNKIKEVGFITTDDGKFGTSTDGLINKNGIFETKCRGLSKHVNYLKKEKMLPEDFIQVQGELYVSEKEFCHFLAYYPGMRHFFIEVKRDEEFLSKLKIELELTYENLQETINKIK